MRVPDLIRKKRDGGELSREEIGCLVSGYAAGTVPAYQIAALAMAIYFRGMNARETLALTLAMANSGETVLLNEIPGTVVDKHSTGGVGDSTTLVLAPLVASAGVPVAKMSGRGLGHTGGTLDKLEAIPGFQGTLSAEEMIRAVKRVGVAIVGQTESLVPADRKLYALRDLTATVESLPLIAASVMSKKLAAGAEALLLDVKSGDGAFMKDPAGAFALAETMVEIGCGASRKTAAVLTNMEQPLGCAVGNALEVKEAIAVLKGEGPSDLKELCLFLGGWMLFLGGRVSRPREGRTILQAKINGGAALDKLREMIRWQRGDPAIVDHPDLLPRAAAADPVKAASGGYIHRLRAEPVGRAAMVLGAGRQAAGDAIDPAVGVTLQKKIGDLVVPGETLATLHLNCAPGSQEVVEARRLLLGAYEIDPSPVKKPPLILGHVDRAGRHHI